MNPHILRARQQRWRNVAQYTGLLWLFAAAVLCIPSLTVPVWGQEWDLILSMVIPAGALALAGGALYGAYRQPQHPDLSMADAMTVVLLGWLGAMAASAWSLGWMLDLTVTQAAFESTSAWTTTGLSVVDVDRAPRVGLMLRSTLEFAGGAGLAILMVTLLRQASGAGLPRAEGRTDRLVPGIVETARIVMGLYLSYAALGTVGLFIAGMDAFDALNHALAAVSTGGFSTRADSIGFWDSASVEAVTIVLMLLGTTNFMVAHRVMRQGPKAILGSPEARVMGMLLPLGIAAVMLGVTASLYPELSKALRVAVFEVVSALSTTGFSTVGYGDWSALGWAVLILMMVIGGGAGSTAGGLKQLRVYLMVRVALWELRSALLSRQAVTAPRAHLNGRWVSLDDTALRSVVAFTTLFVVTLVGGTLVMCAYGHSLQASLFEMASTLSTVGLSVGVTSAQAPAGQLWMQVLVMFLGRMEFLAVCVGAVHLMGPVRRSLWSHLTPQRREV